MLLLPSLSFAVTPYVNFQARLTNSTGAAINTDANFEFIIYDANAGGNAVFYETHNNVSVTRGLVNVVLGDKNSLLGLNYADKNFFLSINVNGNGAMTPRIKVASVTTALNSTGGSQLLRTYTGTLPISVNNDTNGIALNVQANSDWNGLFDGNEGVYYGFPSYARLPQTDLNLLYGRLFTQNTWAKDNNFSTTIQIQGNFICDSVKCYKISDLNIDTQGSGGGFDQNIYSIGIMGKDFNQFLIDGNFFNKNVYASSFTGSGSGLSGIPFVAITDNNAQIKSLFSGSYPIVFSNGNYSLGSDINSWYQSRNAVILYAMLPTDFNTAYTSRNDLNSLVTARVIAGTGITVSGNGKGDVTISSTSLGNVTGIFGSTYIDTNSATGDVKLTLNTYIPSEANIDANALGVVNSLDLNNSLSYIKAYNNLLRTYTGAWFITINNDANTISPVSDFNTGYQSRNSTILNSMLPPDFNSQYNSKFAVWLYSQIPTDFNSAYGSKFDLNANYVRKGTATEQNMDANLNIDNGGGRILFAPDQNLSISGTDPNNRLCRYSRDGNWIDGFC